MRALLGLCELGLGIWGVIAFWGTPWSIAMLVWLVLDVIIAAFMAGQKTRSADTVLKEVLEALEDAPEDDKEKDSVFKSFFNKKEDEDE